MSAMAFFKIHTSIHVESKADILWPRHCPLPQHVYERQVDVVGNSAHGSTRQKGMEWVDSPGITHMGGQHRWVEGKRPQRSH